MADEQKPTTESSTNLPVVTAEAERTSMLADRTQRKRLALLVMATAVLGLTALTVVSRKSSIEQSLQASVEDALAIDHPGLRVSVDGRDVKISGAIGNDENKDVIAKIAADRRGVRSVDVRDLKGLADPGANTTKAPKATDAAGTDSGDTSGGESVDTSSGSDTAAASDPANKLPAAPPKITASFAGTAVTVGGDVPDAAAKDAPHPKSLVQA